MFKSIKRMIYKPILNQKQKNLDKQFKLYGPTDKVLEEQISLNIIRNELDLPDVTKNVNDDGFVQ